MADNNVTQLGTKPDRLAHQMAMHEAMQDELRAVLDKYNDLGLMQVFISDAFANIDAESRMGDVAFIIEGDD